MRHHCFSEESSHKIVVLIKESSFQKGDLITNYVSPLGKAGIPATDITAFTLAYSEAGKAPQKLIRDYLGTLMKALRACGTETIYCADANYFKVLTKQKKAEGCLGYVFPCALEGYEDMNVVLGVNHSSIFYNPANQHSLDLSLDTLVKHLGGEYTEIGADIIHSENYAYTASEAATWLETLHQYPKLTADIEAFSLRHYKASIGTIGFAWNQHEGVNLQVDYAPCPPYLGEVWDSKDKCYKKKTCHGYRQHNPEVKALLKKFFETYEGEIIWHNAAYDVKVIIYTLWMDDDITNHEGLLEGLEVMTRHFGDTRLITYLATNSCAGNKLGLKDIAHEFAGNYAQDDIKDIRMIPLKTLMKYNLTDCLCTWYAHNKHYPQMVADCQEELYLGLFKESLVTIIQMELTGMPMNMAEVEKGEAELRQVSDTHLTALKASPVVAEALERIQLRWIDNDYAARRAKAKKPEDIMKRSLAVLLEKAPAAFPTRFNPGSGQQVALLLHEVMELPVIETTDTGLPAADDDTLKALLNHLDNMPNIQLLTVEEHQHYKDVIQHIRGYLGVDKILGTFIPAFKEAQLGKDGIHYLFGGFNLGGTKSGRLSSSKPNLQNLPSGSTYAKIVKRMFRGNSDWLFAGADYNALEDVVNALLTKDPNKLRILIEGIDGHTYRMMHYWPHLFPDVNFNALTKEIVNSFKKPFDTQRSNSKPVSFALQYQGTWATLVKNCGFTKEEAQAIEENFHGLYQVSTQYTKDRLEQACKDGYVTLAYGLRLRTPILNRTILGLRCTPKEAAAESRTAGNALSGQSYGLVNCKAANEFMKRVRNSKYRLDIKIAAQIHDAIYLIIRNELEIIEWANRNLIECMRERVEGELPELYHPDVTLNAELDLFYPHWAKAMTMPNNASMQDIHSMAISHVQSLQ